MDVKIKIYKAGGIDCLATCKFHHSCALHESAGDFRMETGFTPEFVLESPTMGKCATGDRPSDPSIEYETVPENSDNMGFGALVYVDGKLELTDLVERGAPGADVVEMTVSLFGCVLGEDDEEDDLMRVEVDPEHWPSVLNWNRFLCHTSPPAEIRVPFVDLRSIGSEQHGSVVVVGIELRINPSRASRETRVCACVYPRTNEWASAEEARDVGAVGFVFEADAFSMPDCPVCEGTGRTDGPLPVERMRYVHVRRSEGPSPWLGRSMLQALQAAERSLTPTKGSRCEFCGNGHVGGADMFDHISHSPQCVFRVVRNAISKAEGELQSDMEDNGWDLSKVKDPRVLEVLERVVALKRPEWNLPSAPD